MFTQSESDNALGSPCQCPSFLELHRLNPLGLGRENTVFRPEKELDPVWLSSDCTGGNDENTFNLYKSPDGGLAAVLWVSRTDSPPKVRS